MESELSSQPAAGGLKAAVSRFPGIFKKLKFTSGGSGVGLPFAASAVGVYVSEHSVYVAETARSSSGISIKKSAAVSLAESGRDGGDPEAVAQAVKAAITQAGIASKKVSVALRGRDTFLRYFDMPLVPRKEWKSAVDFEARKYAPFPIQELECAFKISQDRIDNRLKVVFSGIQRDFGAAVDAAFKKNGLEIERTLPPVVPLVNLIPRRGAFADADVVLLARFGSDGSLDIVIARREIPIFARHSALEKNPDGSFEFAAFLAEIRMSLDYFTKYFKSERIRGLYLSGGAADWEKNLAQESGLPVQSVESRSTGPDAGIYLAALVAERPQFWERKLAMEFAVVKSRRPRLIPNLPPDKEKALLMKVGIVEAAAVALIISVITVFLGARCALLQREIAAVTAGAPDSAYSSSDVEALKVSEAELIAKNTFLSRLIDQRISWTEKMNAISAALPDAVRLAGVEYEDGIGQIGEPVRVFRIEGYVIGSDERRAVSLLNGWVESLRKDERFARGFEPPQISLIRKGTERDMAVVRFTLVCAPAKAVPS